MRFILIKWPESAGRRAAGRHDFDYIGAEVAEDLAAEQPTFGGGLKDAIRTEHGTPRMLNWECGMEEGWLMR